jgi:hypothetical protein
MVIKIATLENKKKTKNSTIHVTTIEKEESLA